VNISEANENTVAIFTGKSLPRILSEGGSQSWRLDPARAHRCEWLVITQNAHNFESYADGSEAHGSAFMVGRISRVVPSDGPDAMPGRWKVEFSEFARCSIPDVWQGDRYPVRYTSLDELGIDLTGLKFEPFPEPAITSAEPAGTGGVSVADAVAIVPLNIAQAKAALAANFGVKVESIEIVIRG
jgi:hypothetical protein